MHQIHPDTFLFLKELANNNQRDWFNEHKVDYERAHKNMIVFMDAVLTEMNKIDQIETESGKKSLFRIYRDVRFSANKAPYKTTFSASLSRATKWLRGGYYLQFAPGNTLLGAGFWQPESADLALIREELAYRAEPLRQVLADPTLVDIWGEMEGEKVKTAPRGYPKDHPNIDLLRHKGFLFTTSISDEMALSEAFTFHIVSSFLAIRPFFDYMSEVLTRHFEN